MYIYIYMCVCVCNNLYNFLSYEWSICNDLQQKAEIFAAIWLIWIYALSCVTLTLLAEKYLTYLFIMTVQYR